jgi:hypothetical protein
MLRNIIKDSYREMVGQTDPVQAIVTVSENRPAANASNFGQSETQARRLRRQQRLERGGQHGSFGWRLRTW